MDVYSWSPLSRFKGYIPKSIENLPDEELDNAGKKYFCNLEGKLSFDPKTEWVDIKLTWMEEREEDPIGTEEGDVHELHPLPHMICNSFSVSQRMVDKLGHILEKYGILLPLTIEERKEEGPFYLYWVTNELNCIDFQESELKERIDYSNTVETIQAMFPTFDSLQCKEIDINKFYDIRKLVIAPEAFDGSMIFRVNNDFHSTVFVTEEFVELIKKNGLTGFYFIRNNEIYDGYFEIDKEYYDKTSTPMKLYKEGSNGKFVINDGGEYGDWLYYIIKLNSLTENALGKALDVLIDYTSDMRKFLSYRTSKKSPIEHEVQMYLIRFNLKKTLIEEKEFFEKCVAFPSLYPKMIQYIKNVTSEKMYEDTTWQNEMHHRGFYAAAPLLFADDKYADFFGSLLNKWSMGGELYQSQLIQYAFAKHGPTENMMKLLAWRVLCDGQQIFEDVNAILFSLDVKKNFDITKFLNIINDIVQENKELKTNLVYSLSDFVTAYSDSQEEAQKLCKTILQFYGNSLKGFEEECADACKGARKRRVQPHKYSVNIEKNWDNDPIGTLVIADPLKDISNIKICV